MKQKRLLCLVSASFLDCNVQSLVFLQTTSLSLSSSSSSSSSSSNMQENSTILLKIGSKRQVEDVSTHGFCSQVGMEDSGVWVYVLFMHTWQRLMCVRRLPAFSVCGTGFLESKTERKTLDFLLEYQVYNSNVEKIWKLTVKTDICVIHLSLALIGFNW